LYREVHLESATSFAHSFSFTLLKPPLHEKTIQLTVSDSTRQSLSTPTLGQFSVFSTTIDAVVSPFVLAEN